MKIEYFNGVLVATIKAADEVSKLVRLGKHGLLGGVRIESQTMRSDLPFAMVNYLVRRTKLKEH